MDNIKHRDPGLDVIRCIALFCVVSVHFFWYNEFYYSSIQNIRWILTITIRNSFMICVPLFMMLTGYLNRSTKACVKYYIKLVRILFIYIASSLFCVLYKVIVQKKALSVLSIILGLFSYQDADYAWYIEMYIGLFLLAPFLNVLYDGLHTKKARQTLIFTLLILTALPSITNIFRFTDLGWWITPRSSGEYHPLLPEYWINFYPITYFYLGRYLRDYPIKLNIIINTILFLFVCIVSGAFSFYRSYGGDFIWGSWQSYSSLFVTLQSILIFTFCQNRNYNQWSPCLLRLLAIISDLSLGAYLTSWVFDQICYIKLQKYLSSTPINLKAFVVMIPAILLGALVTSAFINFIYTHTVKKLLEHFLNNHNKIVS